MKELRETEELLRELTRLEQQMQAGTLTAAEFRAILEAMPPRRRPLRWYGLGEDGGDAWTWPSPPEFDERSFIVSGDDVCVRKHDSRDSTPAHSHNFYELIAVLEGTAQNCVDGQDFFLRRGQFFLLCPKAAHAISCSPDAVVMNVLIRASYFRASFPAVFGVEGAPEGLFSPPGAQGRCLLFEVEEDEEARELLLLLTRESLDSRPNRRAAMNGALALLFSLLLDGGTVVQEGAPQKYGAQLRELLSYLSLRACDPEASLKDAARRLHFSTRHISRILRESGQKSFAILLREARLTASRRLLEETSLSVEEVARAVGFSEGGYFIRVFRRETGQTPAAYRAKSVQKHNI